MGCGRDAGEAPFYDTPVVRLPLSSRTIYPRQYNGAASLSLSLGLSLSLKNDQGEGENGVYTSKLAPLLELVVVVPPATRLIAVLVLLSSRQHRLQRLITLPSV